MLQLLYSDSCIPVCKRDFILMPISEEEIGKHGKIASSFKVHIGNLAFKMRAVAEKALSW